MRTGTRPFLLMLVLVLGCNGSRDQLLADLQSPRPEVRALAVKKLAGQGNPDDLVLFTRAAKDLAAIVRAEAAVALGESQDPRVVDLLGELLEDSDEEVQGRAAMALSKVKNDKAKAYLTLQYGRRGRATRQVIVQALKNANVPGAMAEVVAAEAKGQWDRNLLTLTEGALPERVGAAEELGKSGRPEAVNRLLPLVRDSQVILAAAAVRGLGDAGDKRAVGAIALLLDESFPELRESAIIALMKLQDPAAAPRLQAVAVEKSAVSPMAIDAILSFPRTPEADTALCAVALDGAPAEALAAGRAMRSRGGCPMDPIGERLSRPATAASGLQAVLGLGPAALPLLPKVAPWLNQNDAVLRLLAVEAVTAVGDASVVPQLQKLYEQEVKGLEALRTDWVAQKLPENYSSAFDPSAPSSPHVPGAAPDERAARHASLFERVKALNAQRARDSGRPVVKPRVPTELFDDVEAERLVPLATLLRALGSLRAPGALELLKGYSQDSSIPLRTAALVGLTHLGPEGVAVARDGLLEPERDLQKALAQALAEAGDAGPAALMELLPKMGGEKLLVLDALTRGSGVPASASAVLQTVVKEGGPEAALAAGLLGRIQAKDAVPTLIKALDETNSVARRDVLLALGTLGDSQAADAVSRDLFHDLPEIRAAAATALKRMGATNQSESLDALKSDYFRTVRDAAGAALAKGGTAAEGAR
ncbi:HEAT repeat domain-containing protein [Myxococcus llanfairpwllgwyngyllgogerychwyrndrobwllllantysiliogogogochensis]|uniref:HEAT repeat domain-containing protein n=1 Tax=Myxococcus llanfairpwllgwyngyllgogerychwyrndrobwllllantysiliogogogochensis TaxID=2590453 RepID=A0A540WIM8_9BACT|nr:HEAT repeat domain-containing protein [Myxococcus llanfairpwllgwyngyllgogerychwyrndrobwllllantysiliogogogochensis]TQF08833.1 HEAT repeat domain-containing protein [Myxococcus llanfairpwllgwyngyllgogerychwyrndrobwllllantysiliogogogochensis]